MEEDNTNMDQRNTNTSVFHSILYRQLPHSCVKEFNSVVDQATNVEKTKRILAGAQGLNNNCVNVLHRECGTGYQ